MCMFECMCAMHTVHVCMHVGVHVGVHVCVYHKLFKLHQEYDREYQ